jgi:hypothetical protein
MSKRLWWAPALSILNVQLDLPGPGKGVVFRPEDVAGGFGEDRPEVFASEADAWQHQLRRFIKHGQHADKATQRQAAKGIQICKDALTRLGQPQ